jgi:2-amino-4-hydroxy-6-hydroxymethyldihydropteridine diphosphokinase
LATVYLSVGANIGDKFENIESLLNLLDQESDITIKAVSSLYESEPIGVSGQPDFINCVIKIETKIQPHDLLAAVKSIEAILGRDPDSHNEPRAMDIDILLYDDLNIDSLELNIPHSRLTSRRFALEPLLEIAPDLKDPVSLKQLKEFLSKLKFQKIEKVRDSNEVWNG